MAKKPVAGDTWYVDGRPVILRVEKLRGWIVEGPPDEEGIPDQWFEDHYNLKEEPNGPAPFDTTD